MIRVFGMFLILMVALNAVVDATAIRSADTRAKRDIQNVQVYEAILYAFKVDPKSPTFLTKGDRIFDAPRDAISVSSFSFVRQEFIYSDYKSSAAKKYSAYADVEGSYGAFSAAASMEVSHSSNSSLRTVRMDAVTKAIEHQVSSMHGFRSFPEEYVTENFKRAVNELTVEQIEERIGVFYARRMNLGAEIRKSYIMQASSDDTESSVTAELTAEYGGRMLGASATAGVGISTRESNENLDMRVEWSARGGDASIWLASSLEGDNVDSVVQEWRDSVTQNNLEPLDYELENLWELVKEVNPAKGAEFQAYLEAKWAEETDAFNPDHFFVPLEWCEHAGSFLYIYAGPSYDNLEDAKEACLDNPQCNGITQEPQNNNIYTQRVGPEIQAWSSQGEKSWTLCSAEVKWCRHNNSYLKSYSNEGTHFSSLTAAQRSCAKNPRCNGITREPHNGNRYTERVGPQLRRSPGGETSYTLC